MSTTRRCGSPSTPGPPCAKRFGSMPCTATSRDTAESAYLELWAGRSQPVEIASAALERIVDYAAAIMGDVYAAIGLVDHDPCRRNSKGSTSIKYDADPPPKPIR